MHRNNAVLHGGNVGKKRGATTYSKMVQFNPQDKTYFCSDIFVRHRADDGETDKKYILQKRRNGKEY